MPVTYDFSKCINPALLVMRGVENATTGVFTPKADGEDSVLLPFAHAVMLTMQAVGIPEIIEANLDAIYLRIHAHEYLVGTQRQDESATPGVFVSQFVTMAELRRMIGFKCNVSTTTDAAFDKLLLNQLKAIAAEALAAQKALPVTTP